jgi:hypothetical protein
MKRKLLFFLLVMIIQVIPISNHERGVKLVVKTKEGEKIELYKGAYAFIVGNGNYKKGGWDPLPGALRDVDEVANALKGMGYKVTLKKDLDRNSFIKAFAEFSVKNGRDKDNQLLFYYAGHGHTEKMANDEELGYLVMVDAPDPKSDPVGFTLASVDMQFIVTQVKLIKSKHVLFIFDSCFSGTILNLRARVVPEHVSDSVKYDVRQFITAGRANEKVPDRSVFKDAFLDLLEGRDKEPIDDGYITGKELGLYLKQKVPQYNPQQHPQYGKIKDPKLDKGDFVFVTSKIEREEREVLTLSASRVAKNGGTVKSAFKFPSRISYKSFKNGSFVGECQFLYRERTDKKGISSLKLTNFQGLGITSKESLISYIFSDDLSLYASFLKGGAKVISEVRLREVMGFDGKERIKFIFKDIYTDDEIQKEHFIGHNFNPIDLLSALFVTSQRVASGKYDSKERFDLIFGKRIRVVDMVHLGRKKIPFQGKEVSSEVLAIVYLNNELFRLNIFKDNEGYCFPVKISFVDFFSKDGKASESNINRRPQKVYISNLSFINVLTQTAMSQPEFAEMIDYAVIKGMMDAQGNIPDLAVNDPYHRIPNTDANVNTLVNTVFDPNLTEREKYNNLIKLMALYNIDVLVTGHYIDDAKSQLISIRPIIFTKSSPTVLVKNLQFTKEELWCEDPNNKGKVLCPVAFDQIAQAVQDILEQI